MERTGRVVLVMLGVIILVVLGMSALVLLHPGVASAWRVYGVAEVQGGLQQDPQSWAGRTILVQV